MCYFALDVCNWNSNVIRVRQAARPPNKKQRQRQISAGIYGWVVVVGVGWDGERGAGGHSVHSVARCVPTADRRRTEIDTASSTSTPMFFSSSSSLHWALFFLPCQTCATVQYIVAVDQCLAQGNRVPSPPPSTPDSFSLSSSLSRINNNRRRRERKKVKEKTNLEHSQYIPPVHLPVAQ